MWDIILEEDKLYNISIDMFDDEIDKDKVYTISRDINKLCFYKNTIYCKGRFSIDKLIREDFNFFHPFKKRKIIAVICKCIDTLTFVR